MSGLTETLAKFIADPGMVRAPEAASAIIRTGFIDTIATMLAGCDEPVVRVTRSHVASRRSSAHEASVLLGLDRIGAIDAALINGAAGHALDYDDVALAGHPSTVLVPAILAEGEAIGATGIDAIRAYLVGYEVWAELGGRDADQHHLKGWHPTGVFGTVGAAAAVGHLRKLSAPLAQHALSLAASMSSGLVANFGTMTKPFHAGRAAANGIEAVRLAIAGLTAAPDALEHHAGFLAALSPKGNADRTRPTKDLGKTLAILSQGLSIKKYPMCYATHRVIDGVLDVVNKNDLLPEQVRAVHATVGVAQASMLRNHAPVTALEAKFSLEFAVASALHARAVGLAQLDDQFVNREDVRASMKKLHIDTDSSNCPVEPVFSMTDRVRIEMRDGRSLDSGAIRFARGNAQLPLRDGELQAKFLDCARAASHINAPSLYAKLAKLDSITDLNLLARETATV